jgi:LAS superfamily LD-carboxypeptidase LdcB
MKLNQIINIILGGVMILLIITIIALSCVIDNTRKQNIILKQEKNYLSQTVDKMKKESIKQQEIYAEEERLLQKVKKAKTLDEYIQVWNEINRSNK